MLRIEDFGYQHFYIAQMDFHKRIQINLIRWLDTSMFFDVSIKYLFYNMISELKDQYKFLIFFMYFS